MEHLEISNSVSYRIGNLVRTIRIESFNWGVNIVASDKTDGNVNSRFYSRKFRMTKNYPTIEDNIKRGMGYFNAPKEIIDKFLKRR